MDELRRSIKPAAIPDEAQAQRWLERGRAGVVRRRQGRHRLSAVVGALVVVVSLGLSTRYFESGSVGAKHQGEDLIAEILLEDLNYDSGDMSFIPLADDEWSY